MNRILNLDAATLLRKKRALRTQLLQSPGLVEKRVAIVCGPTAGELKDQLELVLLSGGIKPVFWEGDYNKYFEDAVFGEPELEAFKPDLTYLHISVASVRGWSQAGDDTQAVETAFKNEWSRWVQVLDGLRRLGCPVVTNNFEDPPLRLFGSLDAVDPRGRVRYVSRLNEALAQRVLETNGLYLHDLRRVAAWVGLRTWHDRRLWHWAKLPAAQEALPHWARSLGMLMLALFGRAKKLLALDLDNTLWGGVVGDDGMQGLKIGPDEAEGESYLEFQRYVLDLRSRGVALAVVSKNDDANARAGLAHPDGVLKAADFAAFRANWDPKSENLQSIAHALNLGRDSIVFVDDNPAERSLVSSQTPDIFVPDVGADVSNYATLLDALACFETAGLSAEDLGRAEAYAANAQRDQVQATFADYGQFLDSLQMRAEIGPWKEPYFDRISQLSNKSNQFNLTTRRLNLDEARAWAAEPPRITLLGRLTDRFGEHGLISLVSGHQQGAVLDLDLWLMSCRVLKRGMEDAMLDALVTAAKGIGAARLKGHYLPTAKNAMVKEFYGHMGFTRINENADGGSEWDLDLGAYAIRNQHIEVLP
jgi:FkbH-like protein